MLDLIVPSPDKYEEVVPPKSRNMFPPDALDKNTDNLVFEDFYSFVISISADVPIEVFVIIPEDIIFSSLIIPFVKSVVFALIVPSPER